MNSQNITLTPEERSELSRRIRSSTISQRDGRRARLILLAAQGHSLVPAVSRAAVRGAD